MSLRSTRGRERERAGRAPNGMFKTALTKRRFYENANFKAILLAEVFIQATWSEAGRMELVCPDEGIAAQLWRKHGGPISFYARSGDGPITLALPRDFCGFLTLYTQHPVQFARPLAKRATLVSSDQNSGARRYFIGDYALVRGLGGDTRWTGDEVTADSGRWGITIALVERFGLLRQL